MRKHIIKKDTQGVIHPDQNWLDLENLAQAELTSEDGSHPIESALKPNEDSGWRASEPGPQIVRKAPGAGPVGWNRAVVEIINRQKDVGN